MDDLLQEMIQPAGPTGHDRARRRRLVMSAATVGLAVIGVTSLTTSALFTDNDVAQGGNFTTGSVDVTITPTADFLKIDNMAPGDTAYRPLVINNPGTLGYRYAMTKEWKDDTSPGLSGVLTFATYKLKADTTCSAAGVKDLTPLRALAPVADGGATVFGDPAIGQQLGDRPLLTQESETLCFVVTLPIEVGNEYQKATGSVVVTVLAEQTANNP